MVSETVKGALKAFSFGPVVGQFVPVFHAAD